jgi:sterol 3beta-glucosyltransferase
MIPFAPLGQIATRCVAAIHHGGIGTTVGLLAAGLPPRFVPRGFDQPQTALLMSRLGVATIFPWRRASAAAIERGLASLLSTASYRHWAAALDTWLAQERGLETATDVIEQLSACGEPG